MGKARAYLPMACSSEDAMQSCASPLTVHTPSTLMLPCALCATRTFLMTWQQRNGAAHLQVRIAVHHPIIALQEKVFKPLIPSAYYSGSAFHFDLTKAEARSLLEAFTHRQVGPICKQYFYRPLHATQCCGSVSHPVRQEHCSIPVIGQRGRLVGRYDKSAAIPLDAAQVLYHQHVQHQQGHPFFVPPAMCQQLLEAARRACAPQLQPQWQQQAQSNAYLAVLESGLSTQKPARRPDEETPPAPPPLEEILGREAREMQSGQAAMANNSAALINGSGNDGLPVPAQHDGSGADPMSLAASATHALEQSGMVRGAGPLSQQTNPGLQLSRGQACTQSASALQAEQAEQGARSGLRLLEKFDAARQPRSALPVPPPGAMRATGGAPAVGAAPAKPSPLGRLHPPLLSPLVLSSAPYHTPLQPHASAAPAQPQAPHISTLAVHGNMNGAAQEQIARPGSGKITPVQDARPEQNGHAQPAEEGSFSFQQLRAPASQGTPPSFARLLHEYSSAGSGQTAAQQPAFGAQKKPNKERRRRAAMKHALQAAVRQDPQSAQDASAGTAPAEAAEAASIMAQQGGQGSLGGLVAAGDEAVSAVLLHATPDSTVRLQAPRYQDPGSLTPSLTSRQQRPGRSVATAAGAGSAHDARPILQKPDGLLGLPLPGIIEEAAQSGRQLPAVRRGQLAAALQSAALAASQLHQALQSASNILGFDLEAGPPSRQCIPLEGAMTPMALRLGRTAQAPGNAPMLRIATPTQYGTPLSSLASPAHPTLDNSEKRSRSGDADSAAAGGDRVGTEKKQKRSAGAEAQGGSAPKKQKRSDEPSVPRTAFSKQPKATKEALTALKRLKEAALACEGKAAGPRGGTESGSDAGAADLPVAASQAQPVAQSDDMAIPGISEDVPVYRDADRQDSAMAPNVSIPQPAVCVICCGALPVAYSMHASCLPLHPQLFRLMSTIAECALDPYIF